MTSDSRRPAENETIVDRTGLHAVGRLAMHSVRRPFAVDLDGIWDFALIEGEQRVDEATWAPVTLPSLWTMQSLSDRVGYTNVLMPFDDVPPTIPAHNPVGVYRRTFALSASSGERVVLHVGAAEGHLQALVNGVVVGTSSDSHLAAEFEITDAVIAGKNLVELRVAKWSAASYLEDQDQWWQSGVSRSVGVHVIPRIALSDLRITAGWDTERDTGHLALLAEVETLMGVADPEHDVRVHLLDSAHSVPIVGRLQAPTLPVASKDRSVRPEQQLPDDFMDLLSLAAADAPTPPEFRAIPDAIGRAHQAPRSPAGTALLELNDLDVQPWSAETPQLYTVHIELVDRAGTVVDSTQVRIGFRTVAIEGRDLLINGGRVMFQGVARHDFDPRTGRVMTRERLHAELALLKRHNVNAIRTAHYPNDPVFLDLCDEFGFYVIDEADVEGHAFASTIADSPYYLTEIVDRVARMVRRDRNHPSVIAWSLGNETGYGAAHDAAAAWVRRTDPTRPVHYEGAISTDWHGGHGATDLVCPMYASFSSLEAFARDPRADRPLILTEYAYSQGNSTGGLADYWRLFEELPGLQGGFIWEFMDHALDPDGDGTFRYGGDFGDTPENGATVLNGIVFADLRPKPALREARGIFSPLRIVSSAELARLGRLRVRNRQTFSDLSAFSLQVRVDTVDGPVGTASLPTPDLQAGGEVDLELPVDVARLAREAGALAISLVVVLATPTPWGAAGTEIAVVQVPLPRDVPSLSEPVGPAPVDSRGDLVHALLAAPPRLSLWRALTDNDQSFSLDGRFVRSGFFALALESAEIVHGESSTVVTLIYRTAFGDRVSHVRTISVTSGGYRFDEQVDLPAGTRDGLRVGVEFTLVPGFDDVAWVGLGPWENYPDRRASALLGRWHDSVDGLAVPYVRPQENGTRGGTTRVEIAGSAGAVRVDTDSPMSFNVSRHTVAQLEAASHWWKLPASDLAVVHIDARHRGVGTALLGPDTRPVHRLPGDHVAWSWTLNLATP